MRPDTRPARQRRGRVVVLAAAVLMAAACTGRGQHASGTSTATVSTTGSAGGGAGTAPGTAASGSGKGTDVPRFEPSDCAFRVPDGYDARCGHLVTPQDRATPDGVQVRLQVAVFHRHDATVDAPPLLYLEGGPGGNALQAAAEDLDRRFGAYATSRDIVIFDQRGTGYSEPRLACPALDELVYRQLTDTSPNAEQVAAQQQVLGDCRRDLEAKGVDLAHYNSVDSAADVADLRRVLGYASWDLYGVSYGTRLAQTVLRTQPEGVRSVVLDSTFPVAVDSLADLPDQTAADYRHFFAACRADAACDARYPNLEARFAALVARLDREPVTVTAHDFLADKDHQVTVTGSDLQDLLFQSLYDQSMFAAVPQLIAELEAGRTGSLATFEGITVTQLPLLTVGVHLAVQCHEEVAFADPALVGQAVAAHPEQAEQLAGQLIDGNAGFETCRLWGAGRAGPEEDQPVTSDVPTLLLSGGFDPITPTAWAHQVAASLSRSRVVTFPTLGHGDGLAPGCPQQIALAFLADPSSVNEPALDTSCVATMPPPAFTPRRAATLVLAPFQEAVDGVTVAGVRPSDWSPAGSGVVAPQDNVLDRTALLQQAIAGATPTSVRRALQSQLNLDGELTAAGTSESGGARWERYRAVSEGHQVDVALTRQGGHTLVVLLVSPDERRDELVAAVFEPALAALRVVS